MRGEGKLWLKKKYGRWAGNSMALADSQRVRAVLGGRRCRASRSVSRKAAGQRCGCSCHLPWLTCLTAHPTMRRSCRPAASPIHCKRNRCIAAQSLVLQSLSNVPNARLQAVLRALHNAASKRWASGGSPKRSGPALAAQQQMAARRTPSAPDNANSTCHPTPPTRPFPTCEPEPF